MSSTAATSISAIGLPTNWSTTSCTSSRRARSSIESGSTFPIRIAARMTIRASPVATPNTSSAIRWRASAPIRPTMPQSMKVTRPSSWTKMLPGCGSAWKNPSSSVWRNTARAPLPMIALRISGGIDA